jgi:hypothetical protein
MATDQRQFGERVVFDRGYDAHMMAIDGTWRRAYSVLDVSETGAKMTVEGSIVGLPLKEFFLLLSSTGLAYRRCELAWVNGLRKSGSISSSTATRRKRDQDALSRD